MKNTKEEQHLNAVMHIYTQIQVWSPRDCKIKDLHIFFFSFQCVSIDGWMSAPVETGEILEWSHTLQDHTFDGMWMLTEC